MEEIFKDVTVQIEKHDIASRCLVIYNNDNFVIENKETVVVYAKVDVVMTNNHIILKNVPLEEEHKKCKYQFDSKEEALKHFKEEEIKSIDEKFYTKGNIKRKFNSQIFYPISSVILFDKTVQVELEFEAK